MTTLQRRERSLLSRGLQNGNFGGATAAWAILLQQAAALISGLLGLLRGNDPLGSARTHRQEHAAAIGAGCALKRHNLSIGLVWLHFRLNPLDLTARANIQVEASTRVLPQGQHDLLLLGLQSRRVAHGEPQPNDHHQAHQPLHHHLHLQLTKI